MSEKVRATINRRKLDIYREGVTKIIADMDTNMAYEKLVELDKRVKLQDNITRDEAFEILEDAAVDFDKTGNTITFLQAVMRVRQQTHGFQVFYRSAGGASDGDD